MAKRRYTLYLDEHIDPAAKPIFEEVGFRCIRISESRYRGQDEHDYVANLYAEGAVFVTGDQRFIEDVEEQRMRHAGIIWIPATLLRDEKQLLVAVMAGFLKGADLRQMKGIIMYLAHDGIHFRGRARDLLVYSIQSIQQDVNDALSELAE